MEASNIWSFQTDTTGGTDVSGFSVEALDGSIGKVDESSYEVGIGWIIVDTGPWIFGKKVMLPVGTIERIDYPAQCVYLSRTKDEIKNAPELTDGSEQDEAHREQLGGYYGSPDH